LLDGGEVKCWGDNQYGQLGTGDREHRGDGPREMGDALNAIPFGVGLKAIGVSAADSHTCVVLASGGAKCWGSGTNGQLGQGSRDDKLSAVDLPPIKLAGQATQISASNFLAPTKGGWAYGSTCALLLNGTFQCWGYGELVPHSDSGDLDSSGDIGDAASEMSQLPVLTFGGGTRAQSLLAGSVSAAVLVDGSLRLWGTGSQLGQPNLGYVGVGLPAGLASLSAVSMGGGKVKSIAVGRDHACAVLSDGTLKCWGSGGLGQLGLGSTDSTNSAPESVASVNLGGHSALQVAAGDLHTCAILDDGTLRCWGYNDQGQLGLGHTDNQLSADQTVDLTF